MIRYTLRRLHLRSPGNNRKAVSTNIYSGNFTSAMKQTIYFTNTHG